MIKTLVIDGNNLLKIGVCGIKDFYNNGEHVGGIWHFLNTTRRFLDEGNYNNTIITKLIPIRAFATIQFRFVRW